MYVSRCNTIERCEDLVLLGVLNHLNCYSYYYAIDKPRVSPLLSNQPKLRRVYYYVVILYMKIRSFHLFIIGKYLLLTQCNNKG